MRIAIPCERHPDETRVAASIETVKRFVGLGAEVAIEQGAGLSSAVQDAAFEEVGATICPDAGSTLEGATIVLKVRRPLPEELPLYKAGMHLAAILDPYRAGEDMHALAHHGITAFAMDLMPRITRAQSMDVLSSQANLAGYKSVLDAADEFGGCFPMMTTAAGTIHPAKVLVMGAGVAGLQAIATARRLGAIVQATDVRPAAKEQVMSLGAKFVAVEDEEFKQAESAGGYAKEMSKEYQKKQAELIAETIAKMDIVITTALIPGRPAPRLVSAEMVASMKPGSVLVDLAVENGGNVEGAIAGEVVESGGAKIIGHRNVPGRLAAVASQLYARNLFNFMSLFIDKEKGLEINWEDQVVTGTLVTKDGTLVHEGVAAAIGPSESGGNGETETAAAPAEAPAAGSLSAAAVATASAVKPAGGGTAAQDGSLASAAIATAAAVTGSGSKTEAAAEANMAVSSASDRVVDGDETVEGDEDASVTIAAVEDDTLRAPSAHEQLAVDSDSAPSAGETGKETQA